jgi:hypothetical protein
MERFDWLNSSNTVFDKKKLSGSGRAGKAGTASQREDGSNNVSALQLHLMGMTKRTFFTRKNVIDFLQRTEQKAKENARKAVEDYVTASKQAE